MPFLRLLLESCFSSSSCQGAKIALKILFIKDQKQKAHIEIEHNTLTNLWVDARESVYL